MFDRLPTPYGLVRAGVAPDHQKIKSVTAAFDKVAAHPRFRFFGGVELGKDLSVADLRAHYHQIVYTTGAQTDRRMGIPGEDLPGSHPATEFVAWYNGHPDYRDCQFDLTQERVAVVGVGNVAVDVARILCRTPEELAKTDIADYALEALRHEPGARGLSARPPGRRPGRVHQSRDQGAGRAGGRRHRRGPGGGRARPAQPRRHREDRRPREREEGRDPPVLRAPAAGRQAAPAPPALSRLAGRGARQRRRRRRRRSVSCAIVWSPRRPAPSRPSPPRTSRTCRPGSCSARSATAAFRCRACRSTRSGASCSTRRDACSTPTPSIRCRASTRRAGSSAGPSGVIGTNKPDAAETVAGMLEDVGGWPDPRAIGARSRRRRATGAPAPAQLHLVRRLAAAQRARGGARPGPGPAPRQVHARRRDARRAGEPQPGLSGLSREPAPHTRGIRP